MGFMGKGKKEDSANNEPPKPPVLPEPAPAPRDLDMPLPGEDLNDLDDLDEQKMPKLDKPPERAPAHHKSAPPLFVKVDKYDEVIKDVQELRSHSLSLRDALDALADIEKELKVGMEVAHKALDKVNSILSSLDASLLRPGNVTLEDKTKAPKEVEGYIKNVYGQIEKLKSDLRAIE